MSEKIGVSLNKINPFVMAPHWLLTSNVSDTAFRIYCILRAHLNEQTGEEVYPSKDAIAAILGLKKTDSLDPHIKQLVAIGAIVVIREQRGARRRNRYGINVEPPHGTYASLGEWYKDRKEQLGINTTPLKTDVGNPNPVLAGIGYPPENGVKLEPLPKLEPRIKEEIPHPSVSLSSENASRSTDLVVRRDDVETLCRLLADRIESNGSKRPNISDKWRDAARLMIDRDGRDFEKVRTAIAWCQNHEFWKGVILSMPKLREKYDQLRLVAQRESSSKASQINGNGPDGPGGTQAWLQRSMERARKMDAAIARGENVGIFA